MPQYLLLNGHAERPSAGQRHPGISTHRLTDYNERGVMDPQEITEKPQDRTGSWVGRHGENTPQELTGGRA